LKDRVKEIILVQTILPLSVVSDRVEHALAVQTQEPHRLDRSQVSNDGLNRSTHHFVLFQIDMLGQRSFSFTQYSTGSPPRQQPKLAYNGESSDRRK